MITKFIKYFCILLSVIFLLSFTMSFIVFNNKNTESVNNSIKEHITYTEKNIINKKINKLELNNEKVKKELKNIFIKIIAAVISIIVFLGFLHIIAVRLKLIKKRA